ncbi:MAG: PAS domain S-box protein [bacterium]
MISTVVFVGNDDSLVELAKAALQGATVKFLHAKTTQAALKLSHAHTTSLLILDMQLDGFEIDSFTEAVQKLQTEVPPFVLLSGASEGRVALAVMNDGKDFSFVTTLTTIIARALQSNAVEQKIAALGKEATEIEAQFKQIFESSPIGMELYDSTGRLMHINQSCLDIFGIKDSAAVSTYLLFEDPNLGSEERIKLQRGETTRSGGAYDFDFLRSKGFPTSKSGKIYIYSIMSPVFQGKDKKITGYVVQIIDSTEQHELEETLKSKIIELEKTNKLMVGRELKMIELKKELKHSK